MIWRHLGKVPCVMGVSSCMCSLSGFVAIEGGWRIVSGIIDILEVGDVACLVIVMDCCCS
jgi:hypothetical protein